MWRESKLEISRLVITAQFSLRNSLVEYKITSWPPYHLHRGENATHSLVVSAPFGAKNLKESLYFPMAWSRSGGNTISIQKESQDSNWPTHLPVKDHLQNIVGQRILLIWLKTYFYFLFLSCSTFVTLTTCTFLSWNLLPILGLLLFLSLQYPPVMGIFVPRSACSWIRSTFNTKKYYQQSPLLLLTLV